MSCVCEVIRADGLKWILWHLWRISRGQGWVAGGYAPAGGTGRLEGVDVLPVGWPVERVRCPLKHAIRAAVGSMKMLHDFSAETGWHYWFVIQ